MSETNQEIKKVNYCAGQQLRVDDFKDEQLYHIRMSQRHNKNLHTWGIAKGLEVNKIDDRQVKINSGMAIDNEGRELVLFKDTTINVVIDAPLSTSEKFYLTISYDTEEFNSGQSNKCAPRITETPKLEVLGNVTPDIIDGTKILLARLTIRDCKIAEIATKNITEIDQSNLPRSKYVDIESVRRSGDTMTGPLTIKAPFINDENVSEPVHALTIHGTVDTAVLEITADKNLCVDEAHKSEKGDIWIYFQTIEKDATVKSRKAGIGWRDEKDVKDESLAQYNGGKYFTIFTDDNEDRLVVKPDGNVGIGTTQPDAKLQVMGGAIMPAIGNSQAAGIQFPSDPGGGLGDEAFIRYFAETGETTKLVIGCGNDADDRIGFYQYRAERMTIYNGNIGIGLTSPATKLHVQAFDVPNKNIAGYRTVLIENNETTLQLIGIDQGSHLADIVLTGAPPTGSNKHWILSHGAVDRSNKFSIGYLQGDLNQSALNSPPEQLAIFTNGDVQMAGNLGTHGYSPIPKTTGWGGGIHTWDIEAEGTIWSRSGYQSGPRDIAENYPAAHDLTPGDVVCLDKKKDEIILSDKPHDVLVLGVISSSPGFLLNVDPDIKDQKVFPVALCGRVPCKVIDENGSIKKGDLLTTSSTPGHAMKATPIKLNGEEFYRPGTIVGKAIGSLKSAKGVIDIFVFMM